jgi:Contractile injection system tube protein/LysM domain
MADASGTMVKARLEEESGGKSLRFRFNPTEYSVKKSGSWQTPKRSMGTKAGGKPNYLGSNPQSVSLQIFFDDWESGGNDVVKGVEQLLDWCTPTSGSVSSEKPQPPVLKFHWGSNQHLADHKFYLESVSAKYTMFLADGTPVRATADLSLKEVPSDPEGTNPTSGSIHTRRTHIIGEGDSLQSIANREYGKPGLWRGIAAFNEIDDPLQLSPGATLLLPSMEEAAEQAK